MHEQRRAEHGDCGRAECERRFGIDRCARAYLELLRSLGAEKKGSVH